MVLVLVAIEGWSENGAEWNYSLLRRVLEKIPGVVVVAPSYLDAKGVLAKFRSHLPLSMYAISVNTEIVKAKEMYPDATVMVLGHSLGGVIARFLCANNCFPSRNMILAGTPNQGIDFGWFANNFLKVLASKYLCNVPVFYQLLKESEFLEQLNENGFPKDAYYIRGARDKVVPPWSSDPLGIAEVVDCGHKLFPREEDALNSSAIPVVELIVRARLEELKTQAS